MDADVVARISNADRLVAVFGRWPSFHDAEIVGVSLERAGEDAPSLVARIHVFEMTPVVAADGTFETIHHTLVALRFGRISSLRLEGFNAQNVIFDLRIETVEPAANEGARLHVECSTSHGCAFDLYGTCASVVDVRAWQPRPR